MIPHLLPLLQSWGDIRADVAEHWYVYAAMPLVAAVVGYLTKVVAVEMLYRPLEFRGIGPIGWQGIVPRRAGKVAAVTIELLTENLLAPEELFDRFDAAEVVETLRGPLAEAFEELSREFLDALQPGIWKTLPAGARGALLRRLHDQAPEIVSRLLGEIRDDLPRYLDLQLMTVSAMVRNKAKLNRLMRSTARSSMQFMRRSGIYLGFLIGCVQAAAWGWTQALWIMPLFGFLTGWLSDWLALNLLFIPREPRRVLPGFRFQGVLQARREQISRDYARVIAEDFFAPEAIFEALFTGPAADRLFATMHREFARVVDRQAGPLTPLVELAVGTDRYRRAKAAVQQRGVEASRTLVAGAYGYASEVMAIEQTIAEKMNLLDREGFEAIMRPIFKDDEWLIVLVGAVIGCAVGEIQVHALVVPLLGH